jgi:hypothetical protein
MALISGEFHPLRASLLLLVAMLLTAVWATQDFRQQESEKAQQEFIKTQAECLRGIHLMEKGVCIKIYI